MSRTSTTRWIKIRNEARRRALEQGIHTCPNCGVGLDYEYSGRPNSVEVDHVIPHARGGTDTIENTQVLCRWCNRRKGAGRLAPVQPRRVDADTRVQW